MTGLASRALAPWTVRSLVDESALAVTHHAPLLPVCGLCSTGHGLLATTGTVGCARTLEVTISSHNDCTRIRLAVARPGVTGRGHTGPATGCVTPCLCLLTVRDHGHGVGSLGGVTGITRRQLLPPGIASTLGRRWSLPLRLRVAPFLDSRPLCRTLPG